VNADEVLDAIRITLELRDVRRFERCLSDGHDLSVIDRNREILKGDGMVYGRSAPRRRWVEDYTHLLDPWRAASKRAARRTLKFRGSTPDTRIVNSQELLVAFRRERRSVLQYGLIALTAAACGGSSSSPSAPAPTATTSAESTPATSAAVTTATPPQRTRFTLAATKSCLKSKGLQSYTPTNPPEKGSGGDLEVQFTNFEVDLAFTRGGDEQAQLWGDLNALAPGTASKALLRQKGNVVYWWRSTVATQASASAIEGCLT
jgi:hypothetical protein